MRILFFLLICFSVSAQRTVSEMKTVYDGIASAMASTRASYMADFHGGDAYYWWRQGVSDLRVFQATGDFTYLDRVINFWLAFQDNAVVASSLPDPATFSYSSVCSPPSLEPVGPCMNNSEQYWNDSFLTWENHLNRTTTQGFTGNQSDPNRGGGEFPLYEWHGTAWVPMMLAVMYYNPSIRSTDNGALPGATYETQYQSILSFWQENVWNKWATRGLDSHMFRGQTHIASHPSFAAIYLYKITGQQKYKDYVNAFNYDPSIVGATEANGFRQQLRTQSYSPFGTGYIWNGSFGSLSGSNDISHCRSGSLKTVATELKFSDSYWNETDKQRFIVNARWAVANSTSDASAPFRWDGTGLIGAYERNICFGVAMFGAFSPVLQLELEQNPLYSASSGVEQELRQNYVAELIYNRAYLDGTLVYPDYETGTNNPDPPAVAGTGDLGKKKSVVIY